MRVNPLALAPLILLACDRAPDQPNVPGSPAYAATGAAVTRKAPVLKAALRTGTGCGQLACLSYNVVSVSDFPGGGTRIVFDPSVGNLYTSAILVTPDTTLRVPDLEINGISPSSELIVIMRDPSTGSVSGFQSFSLVVF